MDDDDGFGPAGWRSIAVALALVATVCWVSFAVILGDETRPVSTTPWFLMAGAVSATVFSAACAVLGAVKAVEERLRSEAS